MANPIRMYDFWYDGQQTRYLEQLIRALSGFSYLPGIRNGVQQQARLVPCRGVPKSRMMGYIMRNLSENTALTVPLITVAQTGLSMSRERVQDLQLQESIQVREREIVDGKYTGNPGNSYTVTRFMPRPFEMKIQIDIWTSNELQKYQLSEQILPILCPYFDIQNSANPLDWTALTTLEVEDITWTSKPIQIGNSDEIDIMTITCKLPIWISFPAKLTQQKIIKEIINNIYSSGSIDDCGLNPGNLARRVIVTPENAQISINGDTITLLNSRGGMDDGSGNLMNWETFLLQYGTFESGVSTIEVTSTFGGPYVIGTLISNPNAVNELFWQINPSTLPANTLSPITGIINPLTMFPEPAPGGTLPVPVNGTRYLITKDIGVSNAWPISAKANDIIQYSNGSWSIAFNSSVIKSNQYLINSVKGTQLFWNGEQWSSAINGTYSPGFWNLNIDSNKVTSFIGNTNESGNATDEID